MMLTFIRYFPFGMSLKPLQAYFGLYSNIAPPRV